MAGARLPQRHRPSGLARSRSRTEGWTPTRDAGMIPALRRCCSANGEWNNSLLQRPAGGVGFRRCSGADCRCAEIFDKRPSVKEWHGGAGLWVTNLALHQNLPNLGLSPKKESERIEYRAITP